MKAVEEALGHRFDRIELLEEALTHRSFANERPQVAPSDNERLELLGDAVFGLAVSSLLWERFPHAREGELTRRRADLVCEESLAAIAAELHIADALRLGRGEEKSGGRNKPRLLASALEACIGAVYVDGGPDAAIAIGRRLFEDRLAPDAPGAKDYKSRIQELLQAREGRTPRYVLLRTAGPDHQRSFDVAVVIEDRTLGEGSGKSKLEAEQAAARVALGRIQASDASARERLPAGAESGEHSTSGADADGEPEATTGES